MLHPIKLTIIQEIELNDVKIEASELKIQLQKQSNQGHEQEYIYNEKLQDLRNQFEHQQWIKEQEAAGFKDFILVVLKCHECQFTIVICAPH